MIRRRKTRLVKVGGVRIGGGAPVSIQSMTKVETSNIKAVVSQVKSLESCGCEIIRVAVKTLSDARAIKDIKKKIRIPLVADIHFDYRLALESIKSGADKIRINPGNMKKPEEVARVVRSARKAGIPIRIGINSGSTSEDFVKSALNYVKIFEGLDFRDIIISLKASDAAKTVKAYREISGLCDYPLHLGVTASGPYDIGIVKSSIGIGSLLLDGIGDTIRVSLTAEPQEEVFAAKRILSSLGLRRFGPEIISCPTCGRCQVDLVKIVNAVEHEIRNTKYELRKSPFTIALMGCEVNGPGEAKEADIGIAFGKGSGMLFKKGKIVKRVSSKDAIKELLKLL
jgi:(E)-4-hydroxy-3-methylbut-2-enyl-diphosphate synthase